MSPRLVFKMACWSAMSASRSRWGVADCADGYTTEGAVVRFVPSDPPTIAKWPVRWPHTRLADGAMIESAGHDERKIPMGLRKNKSILDQASDTVTEYVEQVRPQLEAAVATAREKAGPALADAREKAAPVIADARAKAAPVIADARDKAAPAIAAGAALGRSHAGRGRPRRRLAGRGARRPGGDPAPHHHPRRPGRGRRGGRQAV